MQLAAVQEDQIEAKLERCRRLAKMTTDDDIRHSLELLAQEYEAQLPDRSGFMLRNRSEGK